jgi:hypothetical protein
MKYIFALPWKWNWRLYSESNTSHSEFKFQERNEKNRTIYPNPSLPMSGLCRKTKAAGYAEER